jgi:hypothetical protein
MEAASSSKVMTPIYLDTLFYIPEESNTDYNTPELEFFLWIFSSCDGALHFQLHAISGFRSARYITSE